MSILVSAIGQGLLWGIIGVGLFLTFRILDFPDMTVEGTFPMGAATAVTAIAHGVSPFNATILAFIVGCLAGLVTGLLYTKAKIPVLLAGILVMTASYSIDLRIMGKPNQSLLGLKTLFNSPVFAKLPPYFDSIFIGILIVAIIIAILIYFLQTNLGQSFIATGDNEDMAQSLGINTDNMKIMGVSVSNGLIALGGALIAQNNGYSDVNMGIGIIVVALASIIIGEVIFGNLTMNQRLIAVILGSIIYRIILMIVLQLGFNANDFNLISSVILALFMSLPILEKKYNLKRIIQRGLK